MSASNRISVSGIFSHSAVETVPSGFSTPFFRYWTFSVTGTVISGSPSS